MSCKHDKVKCAECGEEGSPAQLLRSRPRGKLTQAEMDRNRKASQAAAVKRKIRAKERGK